VKSIKKKILLPFILILTITPLITLASFNILVRNYIIDGIVKQLENTVKTTQTLIKTELADTIYETDPEKINQRISDLNRILRTSKIALNTELLLYKESGEMIYPVDYQNTFLDSSLISKVREILPELEVDKTKTIAVGGKKFIVMGYKLTLLPLNNIPYVVFISSVDVADPIFSTTNMVLITVMLLGIGIGILFAYHFANRVAIPIKDLCQATHRIGERREFVLENKSDIQEIKQLTDSILMMSNRIETYDKAQKSFLQNASHELKTPLMSIQGYAEAIENGIIPDVKSAAIIIKNESKKLDQLLTELLILSRIDNQNYELELKKTSLNEIMKEYIARLEGIALKVKKKINYIPPVQQFEIPFDESLFTQIFMNVANNALRYAKETVTISISKSGDNAVIEIQDDGPGINSKDLPYLFERFYKGEGGQFGLGLAIANSATQAMKGTIKALNTDKGAKFEITLPIWV